MPLDPPTTNDADARRLDPSAASRLAGLATVADEYAALLSSRPTTDAKMLIADVCVDPAVGTTAPTSCPLLADNPEELGLVLGFGSDEYTIVRYAADHGGWIVDDSPVDWESLEDRAFADDHPAGE